MLVPLDRVLPIHWGLSGEPDLFAPAAVALGLPLLIGLVAIGLPLLLRPAARDLDAGRHVIATALSSVIALALALSLATIAMGLGWDIDMPRMLALLIGLQLLSLGNVLPKSRPNRFAGVRLPSTLSDDRHWALTQRWTGRLMMVTGALLAMASLLPLGPTGLIVAIVCATLFPVLAGLGIGLAAGRWR